MVRTLHADLTTSQQANTGTAYVRVTFDSFDRGTSRAYDNDDSPNRLLQVQQAEGRFGSYTLAEGRPQVISSIIRLQNHDATLSGLDFLGYRCYIEWGFNTASGIKTSRSGPEFVISQELLSDEGIDYLELYTINLWEMANLLFVNIGNTFPLSWINGGANETDVKDILIELLGGGKLDDATVDDGGVFTDFTSESEDTTNTVDLLPSTPVTNDAFYFGQLLVFDRITLNITQILSSGTVTLAWEYWNGSAWTALTALTASQGATANTHLALTATGVQIEAFDLPTDWAAVAVDGGTSMFFVRMRVTAASSPVTQLQATRVFAGQDFGFALDTTTSGQGDDNKPTYVTSVGSNLGPTIADILNGNSKLGIRVREDGFHAFFVDVGQLSPDLIYDLDDGPHHFFIHTESQSVTVPNRILVVATNLDDGAATVFSDITNSLCNDSESQLQVGIIPTIVEDLSITTEAEGNTRAALILANLKRDKVQGRVEVPMDCGAEVWDEVRIQDDRTGRVVDARVSQVVRLFQSGQFVMQLIMGGAIWGVGSVPFAPVLAPIVDTSPAFAPGGFEPDFIRQPFVPFGPDVPDTPRPPISQTRDARHRRLDAEVRRQGAAPPGLGIPTTFDPDRDR